MWRTRRRKRTVWTRCARCRFKARRPSARRIALVEGPFLDALRPDEAGVGEAAEVLRRRRLRDAKLARDEHHADAVANEVAVDLGRKVLRRVLQPIEDLAPPRARQRL